MIIAGAVTAALVIWLIMSAGCAYKTNQHIKKDGHWPGFIINDPYPVHMLYGPHDIEARNKFSDEWEAEHDNAPD
jgi:hypothetical protein|tara:strand:- start:1028 stop:1252 length:225 start_codon:yes stop_codon:yes gene_type:complete